ncbi:MAG: nicotinate/nicotinamide nucleotide [Desulfobulbaceae bacterium]|nr:MAG: nicotinate/nicotinamide nucleotide [Desulfobulbaceae bacterium]
MSSPSGRIGLLGGTFDPVHNGHLQLAEISRELCHLQEVWFVPAAIPPHKNQQVLADFNHRADMVELAIADSPDFRLSTIEAGLPVPSYTIDTLRHLHAHVVKPAAVDFFFIIGADAFLEIGTWKSHQQVLQAVHFVVLGRSGCVPGEVEALIERLGYEPDDLAGGWSHPSFQKKIFFFCYPQISIADISSSTIRQKIKGHISVENLVPASVLKYIKTHDLYV